MKINNTLSFSPKIVYLTIFVYPLWTLFLSIKYFRFSQAKNLFWLFCVFLGMIHIYFPEGESDYDGSRYAERLIELHQKPISLENYMASYYEDGEFTDIYQPTVTYLLSTITANPRWLFLIFAFVFGFFYSRNIWFLLDKLPKIIGFSLLLLTCYYALICPIWEINGVRMWTALHVFMYGALPFLYNADKSKLVWCFASLLIHFSFFIPLLILLTYHFMPKSIHVFLSIYILSLFVTEINFESVRVFLMNHTPSFLDSKLNYTNEEYAQNVIEAKSNMNFYIEGSKLLSKWVITVLLITASILIIRTVNVHRNLFKLLCFSLFIYSLSNILSLIPSGGRFIILSQMFAFASVTMFYIHYKQSEYKPKSISLVFKYTPIALLMPILVMLRTGCDYYGISIFFNPVMALYVNDHQPVIQLIKSIF